VKTRDDKWWECGSIQVDFQMTFRFQLTYTGEDNIHHAPMMVHFSVLGSIERMMHVLLTNNPVLPLWISWSYAIEIRDGLFLVGIEAFAGYPADADLEHVAFRVRVCAADRFEHVLEYQSIRYTVSPVRCSLNVFVSHVKELLKKRSHVKDLNF
jgi:hypothetical protein